LWSARDPLCGNCTEGGSSACWSAYRLIFQASPGCIDILTIKHYRQRLPAQATNL
jgi:hypothetical protein